MCQKLASFFWVLPRLFEDMSPSADEIVTKILDLLEIIAPEHICKRFWLTENFKKLVFLRCFFYILC